MSIKYFLEGGDQSTRVGRGGDVGLPSLLTALCCVAFFAK